MISGECVCGSVKVSLRLDDLKTAMCHCTACKKRTGSVCGLQSRVELAQFEHSGDTNQYVRTGDEGNQITHHFCPTCATTLFWTIPMFPDHVIVAVGIFPLDVISAPKASFYEDRVPNWFDLPQSIDLHMA